MLLQLFQVTSVNSIYMRFKVKILCLLSVFFALAGIEDVQAQAAKLHGEPDEVIKGEDLWPPAGPFLLTRLAGRVAGVTILPGKDLFSPPNIRIRGQAQEPLYLLDGVFTTAWTVNNLSPEDVDRVEILKNIASLSLYGGRASGGVIAVYTKTYPEAEQPFSLGMLDTEIFSPYLTYKQNREKPRDVSLLRRLAETLFAYSSR